MMMINSPSVGSTGRGQLWSNRESACHLPYSGPPEKLHVSPAKHKNSHRRIQAIPSSRRQVKVLEKQENTLKVVCLVSQCHCGFCRKTLSGGFSFSSPPHVAHPCCLSPLMLQICWKFVQEVEVSLGRWR